MANGLTKRIIPCFDVADGRVVKGIRFLDMRDAGDPVELAKVYYEEGADELVFLDIKASPDQRDAYGTPMHRRPMEDGETSEVTDLPWDALRFKNPFPFAMTTVLFMRCSLGSFSAMNGRTPMF